MHSQSSRFAGKKVKLKKSAKHPQFKDFGGSDFMVEDYWDILGGKSWMDCDGNIACMIYAMRSAQNELPFDDEVVYGKRKDGLGSLVHVSEIENNIAIF